MNFPKLVIASDGRCTAALLDGVCFGKGIHRLDFSTENSNGEMKGTIRIMELSLDSVHLSRDTAEFQRLMEGMAKE